MNWDWAQIFRDATVAIGSAFLIWVVFNIFGIYDGKGCIRSLVGMGREAAMA